MIRERLTRPDHMGVVNALWTAALIPGLIAGFMIGVDVGLFAGLSPHEPIRGFSVGDADGLVRGLIARSWGELDAWAYHHSLQHRLARQQLPPRQFPPFLEWCAARACVHNAIELTQKVRPVR